MSGTTHQFPQFSPFACFGDSVTLDVDGFQITARLEQDTDAHIDGDDAHNEDQSVTGCTDEQFVDLITARAAWFADEWRYCGIVLSVSRAGITLDDHAASLWSVEMNYPKSSNEYLAICADEMIDQALTAGRDALERLATAELFERFPL